MRGSPCGSPEQEETGSPAGLGLEQTRGAQEVEEKMDEEETRKRSVQVILSDNTNNEASQSQEARGVESWEPVFASVYSVVSPQYIMCFNQTNRSFEAAGSQLSSSCSASVETES
ncbi:hypothetical protein FQA47_001165 [Oryzias melastigma]|uniref:Uncharacterized protein n=1 Tax=Oryzias melastigma TaxID=30732 RepID=A0A834C2W9_ORYME|nr:hypothetical protein FQA47_001165 [Oryzias melastigma]